MPGGADAQLGFKSESTVGTAVTVDKFLPFRSENIKNNIEYLDTQTLSARRTVRMVVAGTKGVEGSITTELPNTTIATLLKHMFGTVGTTGTGPYTHTYSPADLTGDSLTIQVGRPDQASTVQPFTYAGCKINTWELSANEGEIAHLTLNVLGMTETTATALATASFDSAWSPFVFTHGTVTVAAGAQDYVRDFNLSADNKIEQRFRMGSATSKQPLEIGVREYTGTITADFNGLTDYARYTGGTQAALVLTFNNGTQTLTITMNVIFTGETPEVGVPELVAQALPFRVMSSTSDAAAITAVLVNSESSAA